MNETTELHAATTNEFGGDDATLTKSERLKERAKAEAASVGAKMKEQGARLVNRGRSQTAHKVRELKASTEKAALELESNGSPAAASATRTVAEIADNVAGYLDTKEVSEIWRDANAYTKRHPALVIGGMLLAGAAVGRFLRASAEHESEEEGVYGSPAYQTPGTAAADEAVGYSEKGDLPDVSPHFVGPAATNT